MPDRPSSLDDEIRRELRELGLPDAEQDRLLAAMEALLEMGAAAVYGDEEPGVPDASVDCERRLARCRAVCCTFHFALTREEAERGRIAFDPKRPFFIRRDEDGYCPHLDRRTLGCTVWEDRPLRCRRYDCRDDPEVWPEAAARSGPD